MVFKSIIGVTCACLAVVSFSADAALLYGTTTYGTVSIDPVTGAITTLSSFGPNSNNGAALTFGNGMLYGTNPYGTVSIDPVTGATNTISGFSVNSTYGVSLAMSAVPIPSAVWLFGSGLIGLIGVARRKKA